MLDVSRKELKYLLSLDEAYGLKQKLSSVMETDTHNGREGYCVRSLYFDTLFDSDFEDKVAGYDNRQKVRLRIYDTKDEKVKLELKEKAGTVQRKRSLLIDRADAKRMIGGDYSFLMERPEPMAHQLYTFLLTRNYKPKCIVEYDRVAYLRKENDTRVTFDMNLRATEADFDLFNEHLMLYPVVSPDETTLEVKYNGFLYTYIKNLINHANRMQISNSKYCRARQITKKRRR